MNRFMTSDSFENTLFESKTFIYNTFDVKNGTTIAHWHNHMEFVATIEGECTYEINGIKYSCSKGDVIFIPPGHLHSIICDRGAYVAHVVGDKLLSEVCFDSDFAHVIQQFEQSSFHRSMVMKAEHRISKLVFDQLRSLELCYKKQDLGYEMAIKIGLCQLFLGIYQSNRMPLNDIEVEETSVFYVKTALTYIEEHYQEKINLSMIGELTHLSAQHFGRLFKRYTGKSFMIYLSLYRLDKVAWYLKNTNVPITQIAEKVGICNPNYMARIFKENYDKTPRDVRKSAQTP